MIYILVRVCVCMWWATNVASSSKPDETFEVYIFHLPLSSAAVMFVHQLPALQMHYALCYGHRSSYDVYLTAP